MRPYEVVIIFDADLDEETIRSVTDRSVEQITSGGGEPGRVEHWGKRRFAYEMKRRTEGYYVVVEAVCEPETMQQLDRVLSLADEVLRHRVVQVPESVYGKRAPEPASAES